MMFIYPLAVLLAVGLYGIFHSVTASIWAKARARHLLGATADRVYRLLYNIFSVVTLLPVLALPLLLPDRLLYSVPSPWSFVMMAAQFLAVLALAAGLLHTDVWHFLGLRQLVSQPSGSSRLVVSGFYRWVRHPLYTAGLVFLWLMPAMSVNFFALNLGLSFYLVAGALVEERKLLLEFGQAYQDYRQRTPMLVPWRRPT